MIACDYGISDSASSRVVGRSQTFLDDEILMI